MAEDRVVFGADAREYFDVVARMQSQIDLLGKAHGRFNASLGSESGANSFLRSGFRVENQAKLLTQNLLAARSASEALQSGLQAAILSTRLPLAPAIAGLAIAEGLKFISDESTKTKKAFEDLREELAKPLGLEVQQSADAIAADLKAIQDRVGAVQARQKSLFGRAAQFFPFHHVGEPADLTGEVAAGQSRAVALANAQGDAELRIVAIKQQALEVSSADAAIAQAQLDFENKRAAILKNVPFGPVNESVAKQLTAAEQIRDVTSRTAREKRSADNDALAHARELSDIEGRGLSKQDETIAKLSSELSYRIAILQAAQKLGNIQAIAAANVGVAQAQAAVANQRRQFLQDVGSGAAIAGFAADRIAQSQREAGERIVAELRAAKAQGVTLGPNALRILDEAGKLDTASSTGLKALSGQDFSGLAALGNLPFSGLQSLNGLTITIK